MVTNYSDLLTEKGFTDKFSECHFRLAFDVKKSFSSFHPFLLSPPPHKRILNAIRENASNRVCADCGRPDPEWAVVNWGLVVCKDCSGVHRDLGVSYSKVRSLKMDEDIWTDDVVLFMQKFGT